MESGQGGQNLALLLLLLLLLLLVVVAEDGENEEEGLVVDGVDVLEKGDVVDDDLLSLL